MSVIYFRSGSGQRGVRLTPEKLLKRLADFCANNAITSDAELDTWLTNNVTTVAQCRNVIKELIIGLTDIMPPQP